jgi:hypothetical protein
LLICFEVDNVLFEQRVGNIKELPFENESNSTPQQQGLVSMKQPPTTQTTNSASGPTTPAKRKALTLSTSSQQRLSAAVQFSSFFTLILRLTSHVLSQSSYV